MRLFKNLNEGTVYTEKAWVDFIEKMSTEVENSPGKREIMETNLVPLGQGSAENTGDIFALIRGPEQGLGKIFNEKIDENTTRLIVKIVQNCHFIKIHMRNRASNLTEKLDLLVGHDTPWDEVKNAIEKYMHQLEGFGEEGVKTFGFFQDSNIVDFDLVRMVF